MLMRYKVTTATVYKEGDRVLVWVWGDDDRVPGTIVHSFEDGTFNVEVINTGWMINVTQEDLVRC